MKRIIALAMAFIMAVTLCAAAELGYSAGKDSISVWLPTATREALGETKDTAPPEGENAEDAENAAVSGEAEIPDEAEQPDGIEKPDEALEQENGGHQVGDILPDEGGQVITYDALEYEELDSLIRENNLTIKSNDLQLQNMQNGQANGYLFDSYVALSGLLSSLRAAANGMGVSLDSMSRASRSGDDTSSLTPAQENAIEQSLIACYTLISTNLMSLKAQMDASNAGLKTQYNNAKVQFDQVEDQLVLGAQNLYMAYYNMQLQKAELSRSLDILTRNIKVMEKRFELGQVAEIDLLNLKGNLEDITSGQNTLDIQMKNIASQLNVMIGRQPEAELEIGSLPFADIGYLESINREEDFKTAMKNSYALTIKNQDVAAAQKNSNKDNEASIRNYQAVQLQYQAAENTFEVNFGKLYRDLEDKINALDSAQKTYELKVKNLEVAQKKYELGMISELELFSAQDDVNAQSAKIDSAQVALFTAQETYKWALKGLISAG